MCVDTLLIFSLTYHIEVEGIQGAGPQILFLGGAGSPQSPDHGDNPSLAPPLRVISPPPIK